MAEGHCSDARHHCRYRGRGSSRRGRLPGENGRISFVSDRAGTADIWTMRSDGSGLRNLTANSDGFDAAASWSPDAARSSSGVTG